MSWRFPQLRVRLAILPTHENYSRLNEYLSLSMLRQQGKSGILK